MKPVIFFFWGGGGIILKICSQVNHRKKSAYNGDSSTISVVNLITLQLAAG